MGQRIIAVIAGVVLVSVAAAGAFASQDDIETQGELTPTATDTETATPTEEATEEPTSTPTEAATEEPTATPTEAATEEPTATPDEGGEDGGVHGIPDSNPVKEPNGDDVCEKGETDIKTTPNGTQVMVPCHAADNEHKGQGHGDQQRSGEAEDEDDQESEEEEDS